MDNKTMIERQWKLITGGIEIDNKEELIKKLFEIKGINYEIDNINLKIFYLNNIIENDFENNNYCQTINNSCDNDNEALEIRRKYDKCNRYIKSLIDLINEKKTYIFKKKIFTKNFN
jgi:hypothetical protein